jgi:hypothetical protein
MLRAPWVRDFFDTDGVPIANPSKYRWVPLLRLGARTGGQATRSPSPGPRVGSRCFSGGLAGEHGVPHSAFVLPLTASCGLKLADHRQTGKLPRLRFMRAASASNPGRCRCRPRTKLDLPCRLPRDICNAVGPPQAPHPRALAARRRSARGVYLGAPYVMMRHVKIKVPLTTEEVYLNQSL